MGPEPPGNDPFDAWRLDDDFVDGAAYREGTAEERYEQTRRDAQRRREAQRHAQQWQRKQHRPRAKDSWAQTDSSSYLADGIVPSEARRRPWRGIFAVTVIAALLTWNAFGRSDGDATGGLLGPSADAFRFEGVVTDFPTPSSEAQDAPIGTPAPAPTATGTYRFISTQSGSNRPVAYDPCRPIHVVVNDRTMPVGGDVILQQALDDIRDATGLHFVIDGTTDEEPFDHRPPVDEARYGDRWAPVLVAWSDPVVSPRLAGETAGVGGSQEILKGSGDSVLVTGSVALDGPEFSELMRWGNGQAIALAIIRHELGHLVGLDHVDDPDELMYPQASEKNTSFGPGDLTGLNALGRGACRGDL